MLDYKKDTEKFVNHLLACPKCQNNLSVDFEKIHCQTCGFEGSVVDGVFVCQTSIPKSNFDDKYTVMQAANQDDGAWNLCYERQTRLVETYLKPGHLILDVGCSSMLHYTKNSDCFLVGLDASFHSIRANKDVDLKVCGIAENLPFSDCSIDTIVCFYSIHHMIGQNVVENHRIVKNVFKEFARILKPGGDILIFEMSPERPFWFLQNLVWSKARKLLGEKLDMYFWSSHALTAMGKEVFPVAIFEKLEFQVSPLTTFPPIFNLPWLRLPKFLYPLNARLYHWHS